MRKSVKIGLAVLAGASTLAAAQPHQGDVVLLVEGGQITSNDGNLQPVCSFLGQFGSGDQTNDPGFDSPAGTFPANSQIGFTIVGALREWRDGNFDTIPEERLEMRWGPLGPVVSPPDDTPVDGFTLGVSSSGQFHYHYAMRLTAPADPGVYLLTVRLWSDRSGIAQSEPIYLLLNQDSSQQTVDEAAAWWQANGAWCTADDCTADFNGDGVVNTQDFIAYLNAWSAGEERADINGDGVVNSQDFIAFLNLWTAGC